MKGTKKPRTFVFIYVCGVCVCVSVYVYEYVVIGSGLFVLLLHSGPVGSAARYQRCFC